MTPKGVVPHKDNDWQLSPREIALKWAKGHDHCGILADAFLDLDRHSPWDWIKPKGATPC